MSQSLVGPPQTQQNFPLLRVMEPPLCSRRFCGPLKLIKDTGKSGGSSFFFVERGQGFLPGPACAALGKKGVVARKTRHTKARRPSFRRATIIIMICARRGKTVFLCKLPCCQQGDKKEGGLLYNRLTPPHRVLSLSGNKGGGKEKRLGRGGLAFINERTIYQRGTKKRRRKRAPSFFL